MNNEQTIAALCTPPGGAIAIIRISGPKSLDIANHVWIGTKALSKSSARVLQLGICPMMKDSKIGDSVLAVCMPAPNSYTGEDVVELHCHGGVLVAKRLLKSLLEAGARHAEPGEFTLRAFMNSKLDLTQAEAVADVISARSDMALNLAEKQMAGALGERLRGIREELFQILTESESRMDFPEEDLNWKPIETLIETVRRRSAEIAELLATAGDGAVLREGVRIVIAGRPNAGKSSLLNLLLGSDRAIVTGTPGTTRDTIEELASIRNIPVKLVDTAGIREAEDEIEGIGVERSLKSISAAQIILWVMDASGDRDAEMEEMRLRVAPGSAAIAVWNKIDLIDLPVDTLKKTSAPFRFVAISALKTSGIEKLLDAIEDIVWSGKHDEDLEVAVNSRHTGLLTDALESLETLSDNLELEEWELASSKLRLAIAALGTITGEEADPDVLDDIFSRFCIGK